MVATMRNPQPKISPHRVIHWEDVCANVKKTVESYFHDGPKPQTIRLHHVREELLSMI